MTTADSFHSQPTPLEYAVFLYGLVGILGAGWDETATGRQYPGNGILIQTDEPHQDASHNSLATRSGIGIPRLFSANEQTERAVPRPAPPLKNLLLALADGQSRPHPTREIRGSFAVGPPLASAV